MKISGELRRAISKAKTAIETRDKINRAIETAISLQPAAEARLQEAMEALGTAEAEAAIDGEAEPYGTAHSTLADARMSADALAARIQGLQRKLSVNAQEIDVAAGELDQARGTFNAGCLDEFQAQVTRAAGDFATVLRQGAALADALQLDSLAVAIRKTSVANITDPAGPKLIDMDTTEVQERTLLRVSSWKGDAAAEKVFSEHSEPYVLASALKAAQQQFARHFLRSAGWRGVSWPGSIRWLDVPGGST